MKKHTLLFLFLLSSLVMNAQSSRQKAVTDMLQLKNGALLVRLKTSENLINALLRDNKKEAAENVRLQQEKTNMEIVKAFREHFSFCPVYFFYSGNSAKIRQGELKGNLYNTAFEKDTLFSGSLYLVGEFGETETGKLEGFIFRDKDDRQLHSPFPFLIRENKGGVVQRSKAEMAALADKELRSFEQKILSE